MSAKHYQTLREIESSQLTRKLGYPTLYNFLRDFLQYDDEEALLLLKLFIIRKLKEKFK